MTPATRRQILADMGVPVWRMRVARAAEPAPPSAARTEAAAEAAAEAHAEVIAEPAGTRGDTAAAETRDRAPVASPAETPGIMARASLSVLSLAVAGAVMLVDGASSRRDLRLALDVLAAATDDWKSKPASRRFDWPPPLPGDGPPSDARRPGNARTKLGRALAAFVHKDVGDHGARLLLCVAPLAGLLPESWPGCRRVVMPPLDVLGRDAEAKRALWAAVQDSRA